MSKKPHKDTSKSPRQFTDQFKNDAVQMLLDGHTASSIVDRLWPIRYKLAVPMEARTVATKWPRCFVPGQPGQGIGSRAKGGRTRA